VVVGEGWCGVVGVGVGGWCRVVRVGAGLYALVQG